MSTTRKNLATADKSIKKTQAEIDKILRILREFAVDDPGAMDDYQHSEDDDDVEGGGDWDAVGGGVAVDGSYQNDGYGGQYVQV